MSFGRKSVGQMSWIKVNGAAHFKNFQLLLRAAHTRYKYFFGQFNKMEQHVLHN